MNMLVRFGMAATTVMLTIPVTLAGDLSIPNSFTADTPAVAAEVNSNFSAVETEVDDNNTRINTNAGNISTNVGNIGSNTAAIGVLQSQTQNLATGCPAGQSIRAIAANGNVTCEVDDDTNSGGDITGVTAGTGLSGGATSGDATLNVDTSYVQRRVTGRCSTGTYIAAIAANGTVGCVSDSDTTYTAGAGLDLNGTQFSVTPGGIEETMLANDSVTGAKLAPGYASFHASAFQFSGNNIPNWQSNTIFYPTDNGTRAYANANVSLPDGVIVTGIYCTVYDRATSTEQWLRGWLYRVNLTTGETDSIYMTPASINSLSLQILQDITPTNFLYRNIDNSLYTYTIQLEWNVAANALYSYGCRLSYQ